MMSFHETTAVASVTKAPAPQIQRSHRPLPRMLMGSILPVALDEHHAASLLRTVGSPVWLRSLPDPGKTESTPPRLAQVLAVTRRADRAGEEVALDEDVGGGCPGGAE